MATLRTGQSALSQVDRSRQLAAALQQMATSFEPIAHPYQGLAKLAQAWAAMRINKAAGERETEIGEQRQQALASALGPVTVPGGQLPSQGVNIGGIPESINVPRRGGAPDANITLEGIPDKANIPGARYGSFERAPGMTDVINRLPAEIGENVMQSVLTQQMMVDAGITPQQLSGGTQRDRYTSVGTRSVTFPGQEPFDAEVFREKDHPGRVGLIDQNGNLQPLDTRWIAGDIDKTTEIPFGQNDAADFEQTVTEAVTALDQIGRIRSNIIGGGLTQNTALGGVSAFLDNVGSTFSQLGLRLNRDQDSVMLDRGFYETFKVTDEDRSKYSAATISEVSEFHKRFSAIDAENQQIAISLAYTLARIADPGGRLSEMDVMNQMLALGLDQPSPERRLSALSSAERTFAKTIDTRLFFARQRAGEAAPNLPPGFEQRMNSILTDQQPLGDPSGAMNDLTTAWTTGDEETRAELERRFPNVLRRLGLIQ